MVGDLGSAPACARRQPCAGSSASRWARTFELAGEPVVAFPQPDRLLEAVALPGLSEEKIARLRGVAQAAQAGELDASALRRLGPDAAWSALQEIRGIGPFYAGLIVLRASGFADALLPMPEPRVLASRGAVLRARRPADAGRVHRAREGVAAVSHLGHGVAQAGRRAAVRAARGAQALTRRAAVLRDRAPGPSPRPARRPPDARPATRGRSRRAPRRRRAGGRAARAAPRASGPTARRRAARSSLWSPKSFRNSVVVR